MFEDCGWGRIVDGRGFCGLILIFSGLTAIFLIFYGFNPPSAE
jgi:hypothetical protein